MDVTSPRSLRALWKNLVRKAYYGLYPAESPDHARSKHWFSHLTDESYDNVVEINE
ncbi:MAG: hypothetical protein PHW10_04910 [Candidatus Peribacteraceae bacterium]|nr:hypothetical protein [Candidatus Peribacteraceae bacterium]